jgi:hypothetical protein
MDTITIPTTATCASILAIGLGKYKSVVCVFPSPDDVRSTSVPATRAVLKCVGKSPTLSAGRGSGNGWRKCAA